MAIHGLKLELEWLRYHENRDNAPIDAPQTSEIHNFWSDRWIFKIHTFSKTRSQDISKGVKINPIKGSFKGRHLEICAGAIKSPNTLQTGEETIFFFEFFSLPGFSTHFPLFQTKKTHTKHRKKKTHTHTHIKAFWFFYLHQKHKVLFLYPIFFSLILQFGW